MNLRVASGPFRDSTGLVQLERRAGRPSIPVAGPQWHFNFVPGGIEAHPLVSDARHSVNSKIVPEIPRLPLLIARVHIKISWERLPLESRLKIRRR